MSFLKHHPFAVVAWFDRVIAVSFAFPEATVRRLLPDGLELDAFQGLGFVTVALVWTRALRPDGFPRFLGQDFFLAGYRVFTRLHESSGRRLRGLKILRSETDKRRMCWLGNLLTDYHYRHVRVRADKTGTLRTVETALRDRTSSLKLRYDADGANAELPKGSPFPDWRTARQFAGPMPFTFSSRSDGSIMVIEGSRSRWVPRPVQVHEWQVAMFEEEPFREAEPILANAFAVEEVSYRWAKGRIVTPRAAT